MLERFNKFYEIRTSRQKSDILSDISKKKEAQKDNGFFSLDSVNYRSFKIKNDTISIERSYSLINPFLGTGAIFFNFIETNYGTTIKCRIEPFSKYGVILGFGLISIFLISMTIVTFLIINDNYLKMTMFILLFWLIGIGLPILFHIYIRWLLEEYSKTILYDLNITEKHQFNID